MGMMLDAFYPVVPDVQALRQMLDARARLIQLRIKNALPTSIAAQLREAKKLCQATGAVLVVNDHWQAALDTGVDAVHLGQEDLQDADLPALRRARVRIGVSTHDDDELERALSVDPTYVALGPIWPTTLKVMPWAPQGVDRLTTWKRRIGDVPLVAIGGITLERIGACLDAGADVVAVVNDVVNAADPVHRASQWLKATRRHA